MIALTTCSDASENRFPLEGVHVKEIGRIIKERSGGVQRVDCVRLGLVHTSLPLK